MAQQIQNRRDTAANWTSANPTLASGEFAVETDTGRFKVGDGATAWADLGYSSGSAGPEGPAGAAGAAGSDAVWTEVTQAEYDALTPDPATLYVIVG